MIKEGKKVTGYFGKQFPLNKGYIIKMDGPIVEVEWTKGFFIGTLKHQNQDVYDCSFANTKFYGGSFIGIFIDEEENPTNDKIA